MRNRYWMWCGVALVASACFRSRGEPTDGDLGNLDGMSPENGRPGAVASGGSSGSGDGTDMSSGDGDGDARGLPTSPRDPTEAAPPCRPRTGEATVVEKVDILFVVDNSGSMREEQEALGAQFPRLVRVLSTGDRDGDGRQDFAPATELHLGVVSTNMGVSGIADIGRCEGLGDDGIMNNMASAELPGCKATYPRFLTYASGIHDPDEVANDLACIAALGTDGCGFEQQLEAGLKALWPSIDIDPRTGEVIEPNRIVFLADSNGFGSLGHGDVENAGFLRNDVEQGLSVIAVIVVSDEEDCSSADTRHFTPPHFLDPNDPLAQQDLNLRCFYNPQELYSIERYVNGLRALRPGNEHLVVFGAIVGVPADLVDSNARERVDFGDSVEREAYYDGLLDDVRMIETVDTTLLPGQGQNLVPSCLTDWDGDGQPESRAFPPRRIVQVTRRFEENGVVQSICQADFGPAIDAIIDPIAARLGSRVADPSSCR